MGDKQNLLDHYVHSYDEGSRLEATIRGRLEAARLRELLHRYLPSAPCRIADIGGGTGAHALWMMGQGHAVELIDPVAHHVDQARRAGVAAVVGDARNLPWNAQEFDVALLAGPLYHLTDSRERRVALAEAVRVTRPGGLVAVVALGRHANLLGAAIAGQLIERRPIVEDIQREGWSRRNDRWPAATYYHTVDGLRDELTGAGLQMVNVHGVGGPGGWLAVAVDRYKLDDGDGMFDAALLGARIGDDHCPDLIHASANLLAVGVVPEVSAL
ncbi:class I SAM-dependent methyltransferase [Salinispora arenicola]|uniref:class I SAM-dependent methyltransferase n=1 Tax=Salinispora arenicola TaxID=168697 RepID=UPI002079292F|nr:class I SAM-dependent methyltransferase [Salinispora arenicola]MCN0152456.1 class I SAM-dependent methyltransferase [Salinispora arenicola]